MKKLHLQIGGAVLIAGAVAAHFFWSRSSATKTSNELYVQVSRLGACLAGQTPPQKDDDFAKLVHRSVALSAADASPLAKCSEDVAKAKALLEAHDGNLYRRERGSLSSLRLSLEELGAGQLESTSRRLLMSAEGESTAARLGREASRAVNSACLVAVAEGAFDFGTCPRPTELDRRLQVTVPRVALDVAAQEKNIDWQVVRVDGGDTARIDARAGDQTWTVLGRGKGLSWTLVPNAAEAPEPRSGYPADCAFAGAVLRSSGATPVLVDGAGKARPIAVPAVFDQQSARSLHSTCGPRGIVASYVAGGLVITQRRKPKKRDFDPVRVVAIPDADGQSVSDPRVVAFGRRVVLLWRRNVPKRLRVEYAISDDGGSSWR